MAQFADKGASDFPLRDFFPEALQEDDELELAQASLQPTPAMQSVPLTLRHLKNAANVTEDLVRAFATILHKQSRYANPLERDIFQEMHTAKRINELTCRRL